jgi:hypothetical protein
VTKGLIAELALVVLLVVAGPFVVHPLILVLLLASQSLWIRGSSWADIGLRRPTAVHHTLLQVVVGTFIILVAIRVVIVPGAVWLTGVPLDLSVFGKPGDEQALWIWLGQAWTLAAFGEEMVFRGYLIRRVCDLVGDATPGRAIALIASSSLFGLAHSYQGPAGVIAAGTIGGVLGLLYFASGRNLWTVILCHGLVDTAAVTALYFDRRSWLIG